MVSVTYMSAHSASIISVRYYPTQKRNAAQNSSKRSTQNRWNRGLGSKSPLPLYYMPAIIYSSNNRVNPYGRRCNLS